MKKAVLFVLSFVCAAMLAFAQAEGPSSPGTAAKVPAPASEVLPSPAPESAQTPVAPASAPAAVPPNSKTAASAKPAAAAAEPKAYVIGPLDVLLIKVWHQPDLSGPVDVGPDGMISLQLVGELKADGLTAKQLTQVITQKLKECCVNNPEGEVDVQVAKNNSKRYYVYGGVGRPGEYPLDRDTSVMDAMSLVGGFKDFANKKKIRVLRGTKTFYFNYNEVSKGRHMEENILLENGDRVFVPE